MSEISKPFLQVNNVAGETSLGTINPDNAFSFTAEPGMVLGFPEGKNPTLLFRLLMALGDLSQGIIHYASLGGGPITLGPLKATDKKRPLGLFRIPGHLYVHLGLAARDKGTLSNLSLLENTALPARYHNLTHEGIGPDDLARQALQEALIPEKHWNTRPDHVSWEYRKKCLLARSVVCQPKILFMEDPTNLVSWEKIGEVLFWIEKQRSRGTLILLCSENLPFVYAACTHLLSNDHQSVVPCQSIVNEKGDFWPALVAKLKNESTLINKDSHELKDHSNAT